jgi:hypothetical protein
LEKRVTRKKAALGSGKLDMIRRILDIESECFVVAKELRDEVRSSFGWCENGPQELVSLNSCYSLKHGYGGNRNFGAL